MSACARVCVHARSSSGSRVLAARAGPLQDAHGHEHGQEARQWGVRALHVKGQQWGGGGNRGRARNGRHACRHSGQQSMMHHCSVRVCCSPSLEPSFFPAVWERVSGQCDEPTCKWAHFNEHTRAPAMHPTCVSSWKKELLST